MNSLLFSRSNMISSVVRQQVRHGGTIKVILLQDLINRGNAGAVVAVKRGFARNYLIPRKIAAYSTSDNLGRYSSIIHANKIASQSATEGSQVANA